MPRLPRAVSRDHFLQVKWSGFLTTLRGSRKSEPHSSTMPTCAESLQASGSRVRYGPTPPFTITARRSRHCRRSVSAIGANGQPARRSVESGDAHRRRPIDRPGRVTCCGARTLYGTIPTMRRRDLRTRDIPNRPPLPSIEQTPATAPMYPPELSTDDTARMQVRHLAASAGSARRPAAIGSSTSPLVGLVLILGEIAARTVAERATLTGMQPRDLPFGAAESLDDLERPPPPAAA